ncbi:MAG: S1 RNA-binding domain-containing protein [Candidatus Omnitrophica bacterium]|nr:S1 RNA-binding domain-containing protein [Candidatus Omnitrophota bacterium]MDD5311108.1 S1 RNA-binding domain-containing protein [Candidatus Omnitrophota bacterium]MDD5546432.1 S1 RNA-binding domain-containing protein [Candidatus Omnitrophota bacterium]
MESSATQEVKIDDVVDAEVMKIAEFGAFVKFGNKKGLIHISQVSDSYVKKVEDHLKVGDKVKAKIIKVSPDGKIDLTLKSGKEQASRQPRGQFPSGGRPQREHGGRRGGRPDSGFRENMSSSPEGKSFKASPFEDKLKNFLVDSGELQTDIKKHVEEKQGR